MIDYPTKEEWLELIRDYKPPKQETITLHEYKMLEEIVAEFKCPIGRKPFYCDGKVCPSKPTFPFDDYYYECQDVMKHRIKLLKVERGEIKVVR